MAPRKLDLGWLRIFAAVGRHGSLSAAAAELGLSQPAVSYQVRRIEEQVGLPLFQRHSGGSKPTAAGHLLLAAVQAGVAGIDAATQEARALAKAPVIRIFTDYGFAAFWLMPRVTEFRALHPEVQVHIIASQGIDEGLDGSADAAILFGRRSDMPEGARLLMPERVVPVCSPGFLARHGPFATLADLAQSPLLHLENEGPSRWFTWASWLHTQGITRAPAPGDMGLNTYGFVIQAALAEQGVALGWVQLIASHLANGTLVPVGPQVERADCGYWLVTRPDLPGIPRALTDWLAATAQDSG